MSWRKDVDAALRERNERSNAREAELNKIQFTHRGALNLVACQLCGAVVLSPGLHIPHCPERTETP